MTITRFFLSGLVGFLLGAVAGNGQAAEPVKIKYDLGWLFEGGQSYWPLAEKTGCFAREGLDVSIDRGFGSTDTANKVSSGIYDLGETDFNTMAQYDAANPDRKLIAIFMISDGSPTSVVALKKSGIAKPRDLIGKRIGDTIGETSRVMFPAFAKANGVDPNAVEWISVAPNLRQQLLVNDRADAIAGHVFTIVTGLRLLGIKDEEMSIMRYPQWGADFFGSAVVTTAAWAEAHPDAAKAFVRCTVEGMKGAIADPKAAIEALKAHNSLLDEATELAGLDFANELALTANVRKNGLSFVTRERLERTLAQAGDALRLKMLPIDDLWTDKYLPPRSTLMVK